MKNTPEDMDHPTPEAIPPSQRVVELQERILAENGFPLTRESVILDFGCGSGRHVYEHLDLGYKNVFGYDVRNYVDLRKPEDIERFRFDEKDRITRIPFPDDTFDFVFSTSVFEHVLDPEIAFREIYRVLKPGGVSIHDFPAKWRPIEPHIYVPFGAAFQSYGYYLFWALLGVRNEYQKGKSARDVARNNCEYAKVGLNYPNGRTIDRMLGACFDTFSYQERIYTKHGPGRSATLYPLLKAFPFLVFLFRLLHTRIVLLTKRPAP
ncbi:MAG: class I SAM-dependent methyltransferase [Alphaproteobacteria bacterium]|nr:class I SAM-dependent methyltransferase [Alphaproteobacteria bacterium]